MSSTRFLIYVACPYSHIDPEVVLHRFNTVNKVTGLIIETFRSIIPFSPITYTHQFDKLITEQDWYAFDLDFLYRCDALLVLQLDGWEESYGVQLEIREAKKKGLPILYATPDGYETRTDVVSVLLDYLQRNLEQDKLDKE